MSLRCSIRTPVLFLRGGRCDGACRRVADVLMFSTLHIGLSSLDFLGVSHEDETSFVAWGGGR